MSGRRVDWTTAGALAIAVLAATTFALSFSTRCERGPTHSAALARCDK
jgi:hypothetical protein